MHTHIIQIQSYLTIHRTEIWWALVFAVVFAAIFAVIVDLLAIGSKVRAWIRHLRNQWSERSAAQLRKRIVELEKQRDNISAYLASDKPLYLATFRIVIGMLFAIAIAGALSALGDVLGQPIDILSLLFYILAGIIGVQGFTISSLDTREKVAALVAKLKSEVLELQKKLDAMGK